MQCNSKTLDYVKCSKCPPLVITHDLSLHALDEFNCVPRGRQCLAERKSTSTQCVEDPTDVARIDPAAWEDHQPRCHCARHACCLLWHSSRPRRRQWPRAVAGGARLICLSIRLQSVATASTGGPLVLRACHQYAVPGFHLMPLGILQLTAVRHQRRATAPRAVGPERSCALRRLVTRARRCDCMWPHHTCTAAATLAASSPANQFPDCGTDPPVASGRSTLIPRRRLPDIGRRPLRYGSSDIRMLSVTRTHNRFGDRSFTAADPRLWNELPADLLRLNLTL